MRGTVAVEHQRPGLTRDHDARADVPGQVRQRNGGRQAARVLSTVRAATGRAFASDDERDAFEAPILETYEREGSPYYATARLWDDGVIDPLDTRRVLAMGLDAALHAPIPDTRFGVFRILNSKA